MRGACRLPHEKVRVVTEQMSWIYGIEEVKFGDSKQLFSPNARIITENDANLQSNHGMELYK